MTLLTQAGALHSGHDLWVLPQYGNSFWTAKIDWMINFQILKNLRFQKQQALPELDKILENNQIDRLPFTYGNELLLIGTSLILPNKWILFNSGNTISDDKFDIHGWIKQTHQTWSALKNPTLLFFVPHSVTSTKLAQAWDKLEPLFDISTVQDP